MTASRASATARTSVRVSLDAQVHVEQRRASGRVATTFVNTTADALGSGYFWLYGNRFSKRSPAISDVNFYWVYPRRFDAGYTSVRSVKVGDRVLAAGALKVRAHGRAGPGTLLELRLPEPLLPGKAITVEISFVTRVPERFGSYGCAQGGCVLMGGFYPMLATLDDAGWNLGAPPARARYSGTIKLDRPRPSLVFAQGQRARVFAISGEGAFLPLVVQKRRFARRLEHRGVTVTYYASDEPPPTNEAKKHILPYSKEDYGEMITDAATAAIDMMAEIKAPIAPGTHWVLVEAPLRLSLAEANEHSVLVSDRLFRVFPIRRARKFHERELVRAILASHYQSRARRESHDTSREIEIVAEATASYLVEIYTVRAWRKSEFARDILKPVSFVPMVDQILYAPQIAFTSAYFGNVRDGDRFRDSVTRFTHGQPPGRFFYEKLRDLLGKKNFARAMRALVLRKATLQSAVEAAHGKPMGWFMRQWRRPPARVNYRLGKHQAERTKGGRYRHTVEVERDVWPDDEPPVEPVSVRVRDDDDKRHDLVWDGRGKKGQLSFFSTSDSLDVIHIDPKYRLSETAPMGSSADPKLDNRDPARAKFVYQSLGALIDFTSLTASLVTDFEFGRMHDNENRFRLLLFWTDASVGGAVTYSRPFGKKITENRLNKQWSVSTRLARLDDEINGTPFDPGWRVSLGAGIGGDSGIFLFEPLSSANWFAGFGYTSTHFDDQAGLRHRLSLSASATRIVTPVDGHTLVFNVAGAVVAGDLETLGQLLDAGGPDQLRGYSPVWLRGRARAIANFEYRLALWHNLSENFGHWWWWRGMGLAAFADVGAVSGCSAYRDIVDSENLFASAGFGLRFFYDNLGIQQGMMTLDFAVPLNRRERRCLGNTLGVAAPQLTVNLNFLPPF